MTTDQMALYARMGGLTTRMRHSPSEYTTQGLERVNGRNGEIGQHWLDLVDPDGALPHDERVARAKAARKLHYARIGKLSGEARRRKTRAYAKATALKTKVAVGSNQPTATG